MEITSKYNLRQNIKSRCCRKDVVKRRRCRKVDFFSRLRDDFIIIHILSRLMPRDAAKCCLISRRWRSLWEQSFACNFIFTSVRGKHQDKRVSDNRRNRERQHFVSWVNKFLELSHHNPKIHEFVVQFDLDSSYSSDINKWVCFAFAKGVERLELDFSLYLWYVKKDFYKFPGIEMLPALLGSHNNCSMNSLRNSCGATLHVLRDICFKYVDINGEIIEYMLSECHSLERLSVKYSRTLRNLNVCGESIRLKHLGIVNCNVSNVNVSISSLVSLKYSGSREALHIGYVPSLSQVSIGGKYCKAFLKGKGANLKCVSDQLKRLKLDMTYEVVKKCVHYPLEFPTFVGLEELDVKMHMYNGLFLLWPTILIQAAPILRRFTVKLMTVRHILARKCSELSPAQCYCLDVLVVGDTPSLTNELVRKIKSASSKQQHQCLKVVEIHNFVGNKSDFVLAKHLLNMPFPSLAKMNLFTNPNSLIPLRDWYTRWEFQEKFRKRATMVKEWASPSTEVVID